MMVFISWSGDRARTVAMALEKWLPQVVHGVRTWFSPNIEAGRRWDDTMAKALEGSDFGVLCLTAENKTASWIMFEAGALAKRVDVAHVVPYLLDLTPGSLTGTPLASFQAKEADPDGTFALLRALNANLDEKMRRPEEDLKVLFTAMWPTLKAALDEARMAAPDAVAPLPDTGKMVEEVLTLVRSFAATLDQRLPRHDPKLGLPGAADVEEDEDTAEETDDEDSGADEVKK
jgi:hypothetical protein